MTALRNILWSTWMFLCARHSAISHRWISFTFYTVQLLLLTHVDIHSMRIFLALQISLAEQELYDSVFEKNDVYKSSGLNRVLAPLRLILHDVLRPQYLHLDGFHAIAELIDFLNSEVPCVLSGLSLICSLSKAGELVTFFCPSGFQWWSTIRFWPGFSDDFLL